MKQRRCCSLFGLVPLGCSLIGWELELKAGSGEWVSLDGEAMVDCGQWGGL